MAINFQGRDDFRSKVDFPSMTQLLENKQKITGARDEYYRRQALALGREAAKAKLGNNYQGQIDIPTVEEYLSKAGKSDLAQPIIGSYTDADVARLAKDVELADKMYGGQLAGYLKLGQPVDRVFNEAPATTETTTQLGDKITPSSPTDPVYNPNNDYDFLKEAPAQELISAPNKMKTPIGEIKALQTRIGVKADGIWGPKSQKALDEYNASLQNNTGKASVSSDGKTLYLPQKDSSVDGEVVVTASPETKVTQPYSLPEIGSQTTVVEKDVPEQMPSISQPGRGIWNPTRQSDIDLGRAVASVGELWKYTLPEGEQGDLIRQAAKSLGLNSVQEINDAMDEQVNKQFRMPSGPQEFLKSKGVDGQLAARAEFLQKVREVADKRSEAKKQLAADLATRAQEQFGRKITKAGEVRAERKQEIDLAELDPKTNQDIWKPVNAAGLTKIYDGMAGLADMKDAKARYEDDKSWASVMEFGAAKLKAAGQPITEDALGSFVQQTGMVPNLDELKFKKALRDLKVLELLGSDALKLVDWASLGIVPKEVKENFFQDQIDNASFDIRRRGGIVDGKGNPSAKETVVKKREGSIGNGSGTKTTSPKVGDINEKGQVWTGKAWR